MNLHEHLQKRTRKTARNIVDRLDGRDTCINCGDGPYVEVHHIDGDMLNNHPMNLAPLCYRCHKHVHRTQKTSERLAEMREELEEITAE